MFTEVIAEFCHLAIHRTIYHIQPIKTQDTFIIDANRWSSVYKESAKVWESHPGGIVWKNGCGQVCTDNSRGVLLSALLGSFGRTHQGSLWSFLLQGMYFFMDLKIFYMSTRMQKFRKIRSRKGFWNEGFNFRLECLLQISFLWLYGDYAIRMHGKTRGTMQLSANNLSKPGVRGHDLF